MLEFVANALGATNSTTSFSITLPTTEPGDILILEFAHRGTGDGTIGGTSVTTGGLTWTLKHSQLFGSSAFSGKTYWTRATGDHAGQTVTGSSLTNSCAAILTQYRGAVASGDPLADATIVGEENASGNETQAQITTTTDGAMVVLVVVNSPDLAVSTQACTSPGTLAERAERLSSGGTDSSIAHASEVKATAGGTGALTWAQTNAASGSWAYAITPAAELPAEGGGAISLALGASGVGQSIRSGLGVVALTLALAGVGEAPVVAVPEGFGAAPLVLDAPGAGAHTAAAGGTSSMVLDASGAGEAAPEGAGTPALLLDASGIGVAVHGGTGDVALTLGTLGQGLAVHGGGSSAVLSLGSSGAGETTHAGDGTSALSLQVVGLGEAPSGVPDGFGVLTLTLNASGDGRAEHRGDGSSAMALGVSGAGVAPPVASVPGTVTLSTGAAVATLSTDAATGAATLSTGAAVATLSIDAATGALGTDACTATLRDSNLTE